MRSHIKELFLSWTSKSIYNTTGNWNYRDWINKKFEMVDLDLRKGDNDISLKQTCNWVFERVVSSDQWSSIASCKGLPGFVLDINSISVGELVIFPTVLCLDSWNLDLEERDIFHWKTTTNIDVREMKSWYCKFINGRDINSQLDFFGRIWLLDLGNCIGPTGG